MRKMTPSKERPTTSITMRMPVDVLEDLRKVAAYKGMSGYQALIKYYVGQGLREDLQQMRKNNLLKTIEDILEREKVTPEVIAEIKAATAAA